jgi:hypothetical protein
VPFATFPLYPPRADVGADIVEPPMSATSRREQVRQKRARDPAYQHDTLTKP